MIRFAQPYFLIMLVLPVAFLVLYYWKRFLKPAALSYSDTHLFAKPKITFRIFLYHALPVIMSFSVALAIIAAARPQAGHGQRQVFTEGIDIILALDISGSMQAADFKPDNRLTVSKRVIKNFIEGRQGDRIGLVVFASQAFTQCPLTTDYSLLLKFLDEVDFGMVEDGTAIGLALATSANRLATSDAKSKIVVLLTDGVNNSGQIDPTTAAKAIAALGIKTYTIGAGKQGMVDFPINDPIFGKRYIKRKSEIDEETLKEVANITGGRFYRATNSKALQEIYNEISDMEQTKIEVKEYYKYEELYADFLDWGLVLLIVGLFISTIAVRSIP
ncbi:MAG: VWA domain-containing protein [candidate division Zixibacteria bacterium]|nr:VWA domain-containing protein [candidate division Zixibacteria bacterium]